MWNPELLAKKVYHGEYINPLWVNLGEKERDWRIKEAEKFLIATRLVNDRIVMLAQEVFRLEWDFLSEDEKMIKIDRIGFYVGAVNKMK